MQDNPMMEIASRKSSEDRSTPEQESDSQKFMVLHDYTASDVDELDIEKDEIIRVLQIFKDGWSKIEKDLGGKSKVGMVPTGTKIYIICIAKCSI